MSLGFGPKNYHFNFYDMMIIIFIIFFDLSEMLRRRGEIYVLNINSKILHYTACFRLNLQSFAK